MFHNYSRILKDYTCCEQYLQRGANCHGDRSHCIPGRTVDSMTVCRTQVHLTGCTDCFMLTAQVMSVCETSLIYPKPCDLDLLSSDGAANGLPHQREWLHNSQFGALCLSLLFSPDRRQSAKNVPNVSVLSRLMSSFGAC
jgi:hypothetical protein